MQLKSAARSSGKSEFQTPNFDPDFDASSFPFSVFFDLFWQAVHNRHKEAQKLDYILSVFLICSSGTRLGMRSLIRKHPNLVRPLLHDWEYQTFGRKVVYFIFKIFSLCSMRTYDELDSRSRSKKARRHKIEIDKAKDAIKFWMNQLLD
jgi:hypothetical protein